MLLNTLNEHARGTRIILEGKLLSIDLLNTPPPRKIGHSHSNPLHTTHEITQFAFWIYI